MSRQAADLASRAAQSWHQSPGRRKQRRDDGRPVAANYVRGPRRGRCPIEGETEADLRPSRDHLSGEAKAVEIAPIDVAALCVALQILRKSQRDGAGHCLDALECESAAGFGADQHDKALKRRVPSGSRDRADIQLERKGLSWAAMVETGSDEAGGGDPVHGWKAQAVELANHAGLTRVERVFMLRLAGWKSPGADGLARLREIAGRVGVDLR